MAFPIWRAALVAAALAACTLKEPVVEENALPVEYKGRILERLHAELPDPTGIRDAFISEPALRPVENKQRYVVCVKFNPKDAQGQYVGSREMMGIFYSQLMTQFISAGREQCAGAAYRPFPELTKLCQEVVCPQGRR